MVFFLVGVALLVSGTVILGCRWKVQGAGEPCLVTLKSVYGNVLLLVTSLLLTGLGPKNYVLLHVHYDLT